MKPLLEEGERSIIVLLCFSYDTPPQNNMSQVGITLTVDTLFGDDCVATAGDKQQHAS